MAGQNSVISSFKPICNPMVTDGLINAIYGEY